MIAVLGGHTRMTEFLAIAFQLVVMVVPTQLIRLHQVPPESHRFQLIRYLLRQLMTGCPERVAKVEQRLYSGDWEHLHAPA